MFEKLKKRFKKPVKEVKVPKRPVTTIPSYIEEVDGKFRVKGLRSEHKDLNNAIIQYRGWKNAN